MDIALDGANSCLQISRCKTFGTQRQNSAKRTHYYKYIINGGSIFAVLARSL